MILFVHRLDMNAQWHQESAALMHKMAVEHLDRGRLVLAAQFQTTAQYHACEAARCVARLIGALPMCGE